MRQAQLSNPALFPTTMTSYSSSRPYHIDRDSSAQPSPALPCSVLPQAHPTTNHNNHHPPWPVPRAAWSPSVTSRATAARAACKRAQQPALHSLADPAPPPRATRGHTCEPYALPPQYVPSGQGQRAGEGAARRAGVGILLPDDDRARGPRRKACSCLGFRSTRSKSRVDRQTKYGVRRGASWVPGTRSGQQSCENRGPKISARAPGAILLASRRSMCSRRRGTATRHWGDWLVEMGMASRARDACPVLAGAGALPTACPVFLAAARANIPSGVFMRISSRGPAAHCSVPP